MSKSLVAEATGKMPFSGKHVMKYLFQKGREASRNGEVTGKLTNAAALGGFALLHAVQLKLGINELQHDGHQNPALIGIDAAYTTANAMATYTQAYLATKVLTTRRQEPQELGVTPEGFTTPLEVPQEHPEIKPGFATPMELAVTLGGQVLFLATMH